MTSVIHSCVLSPQADGFFSEVTLRDVINSVGRRQNTPILFQVTLFESNNPMPMSKLISTDTVIGQKVCKVHIMTKIIVQIVSSSASNPQYLTIDTVFETANKSKTRKLKFN